MKTPVFVLAIHAFFLSTSALAGPTGDTPADSVVAAYTLNEIVVTATRSGVAGANIPSSVSIISRSALETRPGSLIAAALDGVPGLSLRSYGSGASVKTVSLRGLSPEHTLVLVDGQRYNSFQNGVVDFGLLSSSNVERVEIVKGGFSALYGADAIGGVINVITRKSSRGLTAGALTTIGSNNFSANELTVGVSSGFMGGRAMLRREQGRGDYAFRFDDGRSTTELRRSGEDFSVLTGDARVDAFVSPSLSGYAGFSYTDADRGSPGIVTDASSSGRARLADRIAALRGGIEWKVSEEITFLLTGSGQYAREQYVDPRALINGATVNSIATNKAAIMSPEIRFTLFPGFIGTAGFEYVNASIVGNEINDATRVQRSVFAATQNIVSLPWEFPFEIILYPAVRYDSFSDLDGDVSAKLGVNLGVIRDPSIRLRASYGKSFHAPVFNDLYWRSGGNINLRPERSRAFDAGTRVEFPLGGILRLDASYFTVDTQDRIVWVPGTGGFWSPKNISAVESKGVEVEASWFGFDGALSLTMNSTWTDVKKTSADFPGDLTQGKRLIYVPEQTFSASASVKVGQADLTLQHSWLSYRYTTEFNDRFLPSYSITSGAIRYVLPIAWFSTSLKLEVNNMFNSSYQVIALYPMPLREFRASVGVDL